MTSRTLTVWAFDVDDLHDRLRRVSLPGVDVGVITDDDSVRRVTIMADTSGAGGAERLELAIAAVTDGLGDAVVSAEGRSLDEVTVDLAMERGVTVGAAESLTSGLIATRLAEPPGGGECFCGSVVAYATEVKHRVLGVPDVPAVSPEAAAAMAEGARRLLGADIAIASTGVAGPEPQDGQPVGTVFVASSTDDQTRVINASTSGPRAQIRRAAASAAINELRLRLSSWG